jgi:hypothetical protein
METLPDVLPDLEHIALCFDEAFLLDQLEFPAAEQRLQKAYPGS